MDPVQIGKAIAERHVGSADGPAGDLAAADIAVDGKRSLLHFAEVTGAGDWALRSALCRLAQPEPARVGRLLDSVRRLEAALHHIRPSLERHPSMSLRLVPGGEDERHLDVRTADIARAAADGHDLDAVMSGYWQDGGIEPATPEERAALPVLTVAARAERLAAELIEWANSGPADRPIDTFDTACDEIELALDELGVPRESGPPPRGARRRG